MSVFSSPSPKIRLGGRQNVNEYLRRTGQAKRGTCSLDSSAREGPADFGRSARRLYDLYNRQPIIQPIPCLDIRQSGSRGADRRRRNGVYCQSIQRTRRDRGHPGHRAGPRGWLDQRELERLRAHRSRRCDYPGIQRDAVPRILHHRHRYRELRRRQQSPAGLGHLR